jgi:hypothetical protein
MIRRIGVLFFSALAACTKPAVTPVEDAGVVSSDAGASAGVTASKLDAWLRWQRAVMALDVDAGVRVRARDEARLLREVGLAPADADLIEAVVAAVVSERNLQKISGAEALAQFKQRLETLAPEQRAKAEAALGVGRADGGASLAQVENEFGADAVRVVLAREAEVTTAWETLLLLGR